jgi:hypothetical protein
VQFPLVTVVDDPGEDAGVWRDRGWTLDHVRE